MSSNTARKSKKAEIIKLLREGKKPSEIAKMLEITPSYVSQVKKELVERDFKTEGELEAAVFKLLNEGKTPVDVVIELQLPSEKVEELYYKYLDLRDLPPVTALDIINEVNKRLQIARKEIASIVDKQIRKFNEDNTQKIKQLEEEAENNRITIVGALRELSTVMVYFAIKEAIVIASIQSESPRKHVDVEFIKRTIKFFKATSPDTSDVRTFIDYLELHREVFRASGNTKGAKLIDELLTVLTNG